MGPSATAHTILRGHSLLTGWGEGLETIPVDARTAAGSELVLPLTPPPSLPADRLRRASRECLLAIHAVERALANAALCRDALAGPRTAVIYATASAYDSANWAFLTADARQAPYFPYTAPSAVPGEVTIHYDIMGPYMSLLSGANAGIEALWQASTLLQNDQCDRVLLLGVETFTNCADLYASGRWLLSPPFVETTVCLIIERHSQLTELVYQAGCHDDLVPILASVLSDVAPSSLYLCLPSLRANRAIAPHIRAHYPALELSLVTTRTGTCLACTPLIGLLLALADTTLDTACILSRWGDAWSALHWRRGAVQG